MPELPKRHDRVGVLLWVSQDGGIFGACELPIHECWGMDLEVCAEGGSFDSVRLVEGFGFRGCPGMGLGLFKAF